MAEELLGTCDLNAWSAITRHRLTPHCGNWAADTSRTVDAHQEAELDSYSPHGTGSDGKPIACWEVELLLAGERRKAVVEQFTAALLTGLDDLERDHHWGTLVRPGDVADLVHRVAAEVGRGA